MTNKLLAGLILTAGLALAGGPRVSVGISIGGGYPYGYGAGYYGYLPPPPPIPAYAYYRTPMPAPGYAWIDGYWYPGARAYQWQPGYWVRPPQRGARWNAPRYNRGRFAAGYWR